MYVCTRKVGEETCTGQSEKWVNRCPVCSGFNTLVQQRNGDEERGPLATSWVESDENATPISDVEKKPLPRISTGTREFDRVLGGGVVLGSTVLIGGEPGAGKSTLLIQTCEELANATTGDGEPVTVLYVSAEETKAQIKDRADRIARFENFGKVYLYNQNDVFEIEKKLDELDPDVLITDSIQRMWKSDVSGSPGQVKQVQECAAYLTNVAKARDVAHFMVAHVTKDGDLAGPKQLEHLVDATLNFGVEGNMRVLRAQKNRFGSVDEVGMFRMTEKGLVSVENPSELLMQDHVDGVPGIAIGLGLDGNRTLAVELQSLSRSAIWSERETKQNPRIFATGLSKDRVNQMLAVLEERMNVLQDGDLLTSLAGGIELKKDSGLDLAMCISIASAILKYALPESTCFVGEVGLAGEVRLVPFLEARIKAAKLLGFETVVGPLLDEDAPEDEQYVECETLSDVFDFLEMETVKKEVKRAKKKKKTDKKTRRRAKLSG